MNAPIAIDRLAWDDWNRQHIAKHDVTLKEVEEVASGDAIQLQSYKGRIVLVGATRAGRVLAVVVGAVPGEPGAYYVFSARPASRKEQRYHLERHRGGTNR